MHSNTTPGHRSCGLQRSFVPLQSLFTKVLVSPTETIHSKKRSAAYLQGFPQIGQNLEHLERFGPETKKMFEGVSLQRVSITITLEHLERSGEFKGVNGRERVFEVRGPEEATSSASGISP